MEYMRGIFNQFAHRHRRDFTQRDVMPAELIQVLPWTTQTAVFGSYALKLFTGATWAHGDIDIAVYTNSVEEFSRICALAIDTGIFNEEKSSTNPDAGLHTEEKFGTRVKQTQTHITKDGAKVQFVRIEPDHRSLIDTLSIETSAPCCVTMTYTSEGDQIFHVPRRGVVVTSEMKIDPWNDKICTSEGRVAKYKSRGYQYVANCRGT